MASGTEIRANIDTENVKGLLLINGGGAVALLALLPNILGKPEYFSLVRSVVWGLLSFQLGLAFAVVHNHLRRRCSLAWGSGKPKCKSRGKELFEPCICYWSHLCMALSAIGFMAAGVVVFCGALQTLNHQEEAGSATHTSRVVLLNKSLQPTG